MLASAGVVFSVEPAAVDEAAIKMSLRARGEDAATTAAELALKKAEAIAFRHPGALVIGSDQVLSCDGLSFDKPADRAAAKEQLITLRGRPHELISAVVVLASGTAPWTHVGRAELVMRPFSDSFIDGYLDRVGEAALQSVGAYQIEGLGVQLFDSIRGDFFTIMGMPLLPLLDVLRRHGVVPR